jgi:hypothetical protein
MQKDGHVRSPKRFQTSKGTHFLLSAEGGTSRDTKRNSANEEYLLPAKDRRNNRTSQDTRRDRASEGHSRSVERRGRASQDTKKKSASMGHSRTMQRLSAEGGRSRVTKRNQA